MDSNKRFLRYNSITIFVWPIITIWLPDIIRMVNNKSLFSTEGLIWAIIPLVIYSIVTTLPFIVFAYWARLKIKLNDSVILLKSLAYTFYSIVTIQVILQIVFWADNLFRKSGGANIGLGMLLMFLPVILTVLMPLINHIIYKKLDRYN